MVLGGGGEPCSLCKQTVYPAELMTTGLGRFHFSCFRCTKCARQLQQSTYCQDAKTGRLYCKPHYSQLAVAAGIQAVADGGVDASAGVLVHRKTKTAEEMEVELALDEGALVWVELGMVPDAVSLLGADLADPFVACTVVGRSGEVFTVSSGGGEAEVPRPCVWLRDRSSSANNLRLQHLNEANLLGNVQRRFEARHIYTQTGALELLALNPYAPLCSYDEDQMERYRRARGAPVESAPDEAQQSEEPHIFGVAEEIWRAVSEAEAEGASAGTESRSVVVSGESGSGKTESNRQLLSYFRWRSTGGGDGAAAISRVLALSDVLLESFGNASTVNNHNSSRFGKYLAVDVASNALAGGSFSTYLLETTRLVRRATGERNFHGLYMLCAGAAKHKRAALRLRAAKEHFYTLVSSSDKQREAAAPPDAPTRIERRFDALEDALSQLRGVRAVSVWRALYAGLFSRLVAELNALLRPDGPANGGQYIGLLDIFGFESLETNSLEQLLINYANEALHHLFLRHVFRGFSDEALASVLGDASRIDNRCCVALIDAPPKGLLHILDHQCRAPQGSETAFCLSATQKHEEDPFFTVPKLSRDCSHDASSAFIVRHFAADVLYTSGGFLESNNDTLVGGSHWLRASTEPLVTELFEEDKAVAGTFSSVGGRFAANLKELMARLRSTQTHFVRCMKSNGGALPHTFDAPYVRHALRDRLPKLATPRGIGLTRAGCAPLAPRGLLQKRPAAALASRRRRRPRQGIRAEASLARVASETSRGSS
ncbi:hypothetical protein EMIHUDRAFT_210538 [Emiliania huxleyi CCMP1516]|uniref:Myosin motor domain-containing protein n=3 Tax=Emiliania huxleyi TaxID=2903 RepID=A0A0D3IY99_EMIH1|nr:hypothetical protein EMIHUDRAFT_221774 [Emiliania huxleyi CCMP1516]XP_005768663.1 hypothetical protein EMIHUDRAFT_210538 [Emiliania huxleyi CCMP1516]EOD03955.1 hypothetical protein EMIHUDRAFT_221774 [Emiliania huxleyi CCMP1516]EOD16234.1 hypothetical protein EMIHUDRAFT_210538 [Emiliania huxleyi CCMP1516]|eukprot:XP_005756384.1 hypothetical protein EMIHUDRAFT_221774 [Emiliania huxleyi CCMP1516]